MGDFFMLWDTEKGKKDEVKFCVWDLHKDMFILQK